MKNGKEFLTKFTGLLNEFGVSTEDFVDENISPADEAVIIKEVGAYKLVRNKRSDDGDHDSWEKVYHFTDNDVYLMVVGSYDSDNGADFDYANFSLVEPYEYTVKSYRQVQ